MDDRPSKRAPPPTVHVDLRRQQVDGAAVVACDRADAFSSARDCVGDDVAVPVAQGQRIQQRERFGKRLALVRGQARHVDHAIPVNAS